MLARPYLIAVFLAVLSACKPEGMTHRSHLENPQDEDMLQSAELERNASGYSEIFSRAKFFYQVWNKPMVMKFSELPTSNNDFPNDKIPYSGWWYPEKNGGTDTGSPSALKKYDDAFHGGQSTAVKWERENHTRAATDPHAGWAGHCNGFSAAAARHQEPFKSVTRNGVVFEPWDTKALLAEIYMSATDVFLSGQRCEDNSMARPDPTKMGACEDTNPGSFHLVLTNWLGRMQQILIADTAANDEVWNFPVYKYVVNSAASRTKDQALADLGTSGNYIFNPSATGFVRVNVTITYAKEVVGGESRNPPPNRVTGSRTLDYILELNAAGEVIGGEWIGASKTSHPDFVWVAFEPVQGTGAKTYGNPALNVGEVLKIWAESVGADPNNPPQAIMLPEWRNNWGRLPNFDVSIDGTTTGAVFLGKPIKLQIKRKNNLVGAVSMELGINDRGITERRELAGDEAVDITIEPVVGINRVAFVWKRGGVEIEPPTFLRFHAMP